MGIIKYLRKKQKEEDICNYKSIGCTKCWTNTIEKLKITTKEEI